MRMAIELPEASIIFAKAEVEELTSGEIQTALAALAVLNRTTRVSMLTDHAPSSPQRRCRVQIGPDCFFGEDAEAAILAALHDTQWVLTQQILAEGEGRADADHAA